MGKDSLLWLERFWCSWHVDIYYAASKHNKALLFFAVLLSPILDGFDQLLSMNIVHFLSNAELSIN